MACDCGTPWTCLLTVLTRGSAAVVKRDGLTFNCGSLTESLYQGEDKYRPSLHPIP